MTREEAIEILQGAIKKPNTKDGYLGQALDMAIKALEVDVKAMREEIENNMEEVVGTYDASTPEHNKPLQKSARNEARRECLAIIDKYMGVKK